MEFLKAIASGIALIVAVYCDLIAAAADHLRKRFTAK
jgi:hypothetical protein